MKAYIFPGQGSQFIGMGKDIYSNSSIAKKLFKYADEILGFNMTKIMLEGSIKIMNNTKYTQLAIFIYSVIKSKILTNFDPDMVAGHSLGEISALTAINVLSFEDGLRLVNKRGSIMQDICTSYSGGMLAIFGLQDSIVEKICKKDPGIVVPSNYNSPEQIVISGEIHALMRVSNLIKQLKGSKILTLPINGAFHSPIMEYGKKKLTKVINKINFKYSRCPIYQNINASPVIQSLEIKHNLIEQLTSPVKWKQSIINMINHGAVKFFEIGPKNILQGLLKNILKNYLI
ncbi:ACP S-malonyltransferase [Blattabacterium cuenoti]|uniref:ACP S-malonyltransferase n=1 Tax=Blattabacterium cuenoti TaxID=1653831 RepID=UPI00163C4E04|nr:ACP S-malonyltransferase [Blattabacterium cuenoti]